ncbi:MAG: hypothetical protein HY619_03950 [Thaumarchaeota archaeon]|nr:hypothetical protein [Nitrososphaerota archaeon]
MEVAFGGFAAGCREYRAVLWDALRGVRSRGVIIVKRGWVGGLIHHKIG